MKCCEIILSNANEIWYIILYDLVSRIDIVRHVPFCKDATHIHTVLLMYVFNFANYNNIYCVVHIRS